MSKMKTYMQEEADQMGLSVEEYLNQLNAFKAQDLIDEDGMEEVEEDYDLPMYWEPDYNGTTAEERREQAFEFKNLK